MIEIQNKKLRNIKLREPLSQDVVNISDKRRSNLFAWRGQFSPQLIEALIENYGKKDDVILDPFVGSGTVLFEAANFGLEAYGIELNPAAYGLASIYKLARVDFPLRNQSINIIDKIISSLILNKHPFNESSDQFLNSLGRELINISRQYQESNEGIIINALIIELDFGQKKLNYKILQNAWENLKAIIRDLPCTDKHIDVFLGDARQTELITSSIDFVITSPPYINVFNYHQNYRKSVEAIGYNILEVAKSEIGSNRKFRSNRFFTVVQYALDIFQVFKELRRVCKPNAKIIFIVGRESSVRKTPLSNAKLLTEIAHALGFTLEGEQHRVFKNKFGKDIYEEILRFSIENSILARQSIDAAKKIATRYLSESLLIAPEEAISDLTDAIAKANNIEPSNFFKNQI